MVTFGGNSAVASVQGHPNPFTSEVNLTLETAAPGRATVRLLDGLGREVRAWQPTLALGSSSLQLPGLDGLPRGIYVVQVQYTGGKTERLKLVKE